MSRPDLIHLSLCLSPGVAHLPHYHLCIYACVFCLFVASLSCLFKPTSGFSQLLVFPSHSCSRPPGFWLLPVLTLSPPAWALCLPLTLSLPVVRCLCLYSGLPTPACLDLSFACPCCCNKHCYFNTVWTWVFPDAWYLCRKYRLPSLSSCCPIRLKDFANLSSLKPNYDKCLVFKLGS